MTTGVLVDPNNWTEHFAACGDECVRLAAYVKNGQLPMGFLHAYDRGESCSPASSGSVGTASQSASDGILTQLDEPALTDEMIDYSGYD